MLKNELFPTGIRATAGSIVIVLGRVTAVANYKFFPIAVASFGFHYVVYFFALMMAIMVTWGFRTMIDTDKLSLTEIQDMGKDTGRKKEKEEENVEVVDAENAEKALEVVFKNVMEQRARRRKISVLNEQNLLGVIDEESARRHLIHGVKEQNCNTNPPEDKELYRKTSKRVTDVIRKGRKISCKF